MPEVFGESVMEDHVEQLLQVITLSTRHLRLQVHLMLEMAKVTVIQCRDVDEVDHLRDFRNPKDQTRVLQRHNLDQLQRR
jgi:hypothetical protein